MILLVDAIADSFLSDLLAATFSCQLVKDGNRGTKKEQEVACQENQMEPAAIETGLFPTMERTRGHLLLV